MRQTAQVWWRPPTRQEAYLPEGPRCLYWQGQLWIIWVNIQLGPEAVQGQIALCRWREEGADTLRLILCPGRPGFVLPTDREGIVLVGMDQALYYLDLACEQWSSPLVVLPQAHPRTIINDGEVTPDGQAIVFGTKDLLFRAPLGHLYLYHLQQRRLSVLADKQICSNGKVIRSTSEGVTLYDIDSPTRQVRQYRLDIDSGQAQFVGVALDLQNDVAFPDGMCAADDNSVIIAFYHPEYSSAGRAVRFDLSTGTAVDQWETPGSPRVTCPLLIPTRSTADTSVSLLLTTCDEGMSAELLARSPNAGCLFVAPTHLSPAPPLSLVRFLP
jgi:sugar lactone lactonase YvrE